MNDELLREEAGIYQLVPQMLNVWTDKDSGNKAVGPRMPDRLHPNSV